MRTIQSLAGALTLSLLLGLGQAGCSMSQIGLGSSDDSHTFVSTPSSPKTVFLKDFRTGETVWTYQVPVGGKLKVSFSNRGSAEESGQDEMRWELSGAGRSSEGSSVPCPPASSRVLGFELRNAPELHQAAAGR